MTPFVKVSKRDLDLTGARPAHHEYNSQQAQPYAELDGMFILPDGRFAELFCKHGWIYEYHVFESEQHHHEWCRAVADAFIKSDHYRRNWE